MTKIYKVLIIIFMFFLAAIVIWSGYLVLKKNIRLQEFFNRGLPTLATLGTVNLPGKLLGPIKPDYAENLESTKIIAWTNYYREQEGLNLLASNSLLAQAAQTKVTDMFQKQYFEHVSPDGTTPGQLVLATGYNYRDTGENLALGDFKDEKELVDAWMASPGHRANILNPKYTEIGVASGLDKLDDRTKTWLSVQEFGAPAPQCTKPDQTLYQTITEKETEYDTLKNRYDQLVTQNKLSKSEYEEAKALQTELNNFYYEINALLYQYNNQVSLYNTCIKQ